MSDEVPDTIGYPLDRARELLRAVRRETAELVRVGVVEDDQSEDKRLMVIRQRSLEDGRIELTVAAEWRTPQRHEQ